MTIATPVPAKQFTTVDGHRLAHVEMGRGDPIVRLRGHQSATTPPSRRWQTDWHWRG